MAEQANTIALTILEREYRINCPTGAEDELKEAARYLDEKLIEIKRASMSAGKVISTDRLAIIAALNITHQLLSGERDASEHKMTLKLLHARLDDALAQDIQLEL